MKLQPARITLMTSRPLIAAVDAAIQREMTQHLVERAGRIARKPEIQHRPPATSSPNNQTRTHTAPP
ncbi:hypothetical protein D3C87_1069800 [compost metagenome]